MSPSRYGGILSTPNAHGVKAPEVPYGTPHAWLKKKRFETFPAFVIAFKETERTRKAGGNLGIRSGRLR